MYSGEKPWRRLQILHKCLELLDKIVYIIKKLYPSANVYLIGGAAEDRLTVNSDIDIVVLFRKKLNNSERVEILDNIWGELEKEIPMYYPLHIIVLGENEFHKLKGLKRKLA